MTWERFDFSNLKINDVIYSHIYNPKKVLHFYQNQEFKESYTFKEIHDAVQIQKKILSSSLQSSEMVFISWEYSFKFVVLFLALLEIEVIPVPVLSANEVGEENYLDYLDECKAKTGISKILAPAKFNESLVSSGFEVVILNLEKDFFNSRNNPQKPKILRTIEKRNLAYVQIGLLEHGFDYEAMVFSHQSILKSILKLKSDLLLSEDQKVFSAVSSKEEYFIFTHILLPLIIGFETHLFSGSLENFSGDVWIKASIQKNINIWIGNSHFYTKILQSATNQGLNNNAFSSLNHCLCSYYGVDPDLSDHFLYEYRQKGWREDTFKVFYSPMVNHFITSCTKQKFISEKINNRKIPSLGSPLKGNFFRVVDENNYVLGEDQEGFISINSNTFAPLMYNFETKTEQSLDELTWFRTKDIGFISNGELFLTGSDSKKIWYRYQAWSKAALREKILEIVGNIQQIRDIEIQSLKGKKGLEEIYVIFIMRFSLKWFVPFLKTKITNRISSKLKISKENILFLAEKKTPTSLDGKIKPLSLKREVMSKLSSL